MTQKLEIRGPWFREPFSSCINNQCFPLSFPHWRTCNRGMQFAWYSAVLHKTVSPELRGTALSPCCHATVAFSTMAISALLAPEQGFEECRNGNGNVFFLLRSYLLNPPFYFVICTVYLHLLLLLLLLLNHKHLFNTSLVYSHSMQHGC